MHDIADFIAGFRRFQRRYFCGLANFFEELRAGQRPKVLVIACSDSRVDPAILMDTDPGELFVVRNIANLVPPYEKDEGRHGVSAALEFAVKSLQVEHIIVMGHSHCGGIRALMDEGGVGGEFLGPWVSIAQPARQEILRRLPGKAPHQQQRACEQAAVLISLENLQTFPWIREAMEAGRIRLHGWYFDLKSGELHAYDAESGHFEPLVPAC